MSQAREEVESPRTQSCAKREIWPRVNLESQQEGHPALEAMITLNGVSYAPPGRSDVLHDVSFTVPPGQTVALVGRSGAGKSTILRLINGLLSPRLGVVIVEDRNTGEWDPIRLRRQIGYVLQDIGLFPHYTVADNVGLVPTLEGWLPDRIRQRVAELLELVGLPPAEYADRWPEELSGGQRQRVGVARALAADPPMLLMDEPFGALDPVTRRDLRREFARIQATVRKTVVIVTHDLHEALILGDRIGVIDDGRLVAYGTGPEVAASLVPAVRDLFDTISDVKPHS
jgi:osmoprotectant transport system ATP-binding protein